MPTISRQINLPYSAEQMYALVNDVARYPEFVPFCKKAVIYHEDVHSMKASLIVEWQGMQSTFTTENKLIENQSITMNLVQGMLKKLTGEWQFMAKSEKACEVKLTVNVEFGNRLTSLLFAKMVEQVLNRITDAFCKRAEVLYARET